MTHREGNCSHGPPAAAPLDADEVRSLLDTLGRATFRDLHVTDEVDSTNRWMAARLASGVRHGVCVAERQSQGRARRGRHWCSPASGNIYMSLGWCFERAPSGLTGLGLVAGVVVASAIDDEGISGVSLKWPNDLMAAGAKVGGILVESATVAGGRTNVVIGVGVNLALPKEDRAGIAQPVTDLNALTGRPVNRVHILARIINGFADALPRFEQQGLSAFRHRWSVLDRTCDSDVMLDDGHGPRAGHAVGIDDHGALLVHTENGIERVHAADVSLRVTS